LKKKPQLIKLNLSQLERWHQTTEDLLAVFTCFDDHLVYRRFNVALTLTPSAA
jgi:hypothetical protein